MTYLERCELEGMFQRIEDTIERDPQARELFYSRFDYVVPPPDPELTVPDEDGPGGD